MTPYKSPEEFNAANPIGTAVVYTDDFGEEIHTKTRSEAWVIGEHTAVVLLEGMTGGYDLERVKLERKG